MHQKIIFFDGVCLFCNRGVNFLLKKDKKKVFLFSPLQGETAKKLLNFQELEKLETLIFYSNGKQYVKSTAALHIIFGLGGAWKLFTVFFIVPPFLRNLIYDYIAGNRYKWYGKMDNCRIPTEKEKERFLP